MALYSYEIGIEFTGTGTAASAAASMTVNGTTTIFESEFAAGYLITLAGETRVVSTITSDTVLTVTANFTVSSGAVVFTGVNLVNVESLTTALPPPKSTFNEYSQLLDLGNGSVRGAGWAVATWRFGYLSQAQRDQLRTFCAGASTAVYIRSRKNDTSDAYQYYSANFVWPVGQEQKDHGFRLDFVAEFRDAILVSVA